MEGSFWGLYNDWKPIWNGKKLLHLNDDETFSKTRNTADQIIEVYGNYSITYTEIDTLLILTYDINNSLIGNCSGDLIENLRLQSKEKMVNTWQQCDGP